MNSSSEIFPAYLPLEYREAGDPATQPASDQPEAPELQPEPAQVFAARLEDERRAITARCHQDAEREVQRARAEISRAIGDFAHQRDEYFRQAESEIVSLALAIARRLLHREAQLDPNLLGGLVHYELEQLNSATSVRLVVSTESLAWWHQAAPSMPCPVEVLSDKSLPHGELRIETALGATTVSFERDLKEIEQGFFDLLSHRPHATPPQSAHVQ